MRSARGARRRSTSATSDRRRQRGPEARRGERERPALGEGDGHERRRARARRRRARPARAARRSSHHAAAASARNAPATGLARPASAPSSAAERRASARDGEHRARAPSATPSTNAIRPVISSVAVPAANHSDAGAGARRRSRDEALEGPGRGDGAPARRRAARRAARPAAAAGPSSRGCDGPPYQPLSQIAQPSPARYSAAARSPVAGASTRYSAARAAARTQLGVEERDDRVEPHRGAPARGQCPASGTCSTSASPPSAAA